MKNIKLILAIAISALAITSTAQAEEVKMCSMPACPFEVGEDRIVIDFSASVRLRSDFGPDRAKSVFNESIPTGKYKVKLASYDGYSIRTKATQPHEQYFIDLANSSESSLKKTNSTPDLQDYVKEAFWSGTVNNKLTIPVGVTKIIVRHSAYPDLSSPNSLRPVCAVFEKIAEEPFCGNGIIEASEQCDDGNNIDSDGCSAICTVEKDKPFCGNGIIEASEQCDDGNNIDSDGCSAICTIEKNEPFCGNGVVENDEQCDDGNNDDTDSCNNSCEPKKTKTKCTGSIGNYVWYDANADGIQDDFEDGIEDVRMKLKWAGEDDKWGNSDDEVLRTDTNHNGHYIFDKLCEGKYKVYVKDEDVKMLTQTYDPDDKLDNKTKVTLKGSKDSHTKADFGYQGKPTAPRTGSGEVASILALIIAIAGFLTYRRFNSRKLAFKK